ncbi:MAG: ribonuclease [Sphingomonadaceae bacterium]
MAEWLYEEGIGETRAALVEDGAIVEAAIALPGGLAPGLIAQARLMKLLAPKRRAIVRMDDEEALLEPVPPGASEGARLLVEIVREALPEPGRPKRARARPAPADAMSRPAPPLREKLEASGLPLAPLGPADPDRLEQAGWSELIEEAASGHVGFAGGSLTISLTPAMVLIDVDGTLEPAALAIAGAGAAARTIRRLALAGAIGIDLPTLASKADRHAAAAAIDAHLPLPFERTGVNGFGFVQIVRRRTGASIPELIRADPAGAAARAALRRAERTSGHGPRTIFCAPDVAKRLAAREEWLEKAARRLAAPLLLRPEEGRAIWAFDVQPERP